MQEDKVIIDEELKKRIASGIFLQSAFHERIHGATHLFLELVLREFGLTIDVPEDFLNAVFAGVFQMGYEACEEQAKQFQKAEFTNEEQEAQTLDNIEKYAGSFVKQMGLCYQMADPFNKRKFRYAFWNYFEDYLPEKWEAKK